MTIRATSRCWAALVVVTVLGPMTACTTGDSRPDAAGPPRPGGVLRLAVADEPECLDPQQSPTAAARLLARPLVDSLVHQANDGSFHPWLATGWTLSSDRRTYRMQLREGVTFADGTGFDAGSVVTNLDRVVAPRTKSLLAASLISSYESARAVDGHTVEIRLKQPDSTFLSALATPNLGIQAPASLAGDAAGRCTTVIGTGPFRSERGFQPQRGIDYVRNPDYAWAPADDANAGPAHLDGIQVQVAPDAAARYGALTSGQIDAITAVSPTQMRELRATPGLSLRSTPYPGVNFSYWPNTARGPFADVRVRTAFRTGIDWAQIVKNVYFGAFEPVRNVLSPVTPGYNAAVERK
jgi:peptide/nickel transport system substrate-binding protein